MSNTPVAVPVIDPYLPEVTFQIGDQVYSLVYDFAAFFAYEKVTGINILTSDFGFSRENLSAILWAGLKRCHPGLKREEVESWLNLRTEAAFTGLVLTAIRTSLPDPDPNAGDATTDPPRA